MRKFVVAAISTAALTAAAPAIAGMRTNSGASVMPPPSTHTHYCNCGHSAGAAMCTGSSGGGTTTTSGGTPTTSGGGGTTTTSGGTPVPEPGMLGVMGLGLIGLGLARRRRARR